MRYIIYLTLFFTLIFSAKGAVGVASWYGEEYRGKLMANGIRFDPDRVSVAHRTLPLGTILRIENPRNRKVIYALVTDRGPYIDGRSLDLSKEAFRRLASLDKGLVTVKYSIIK